MKRRVLFYTLVFSLSSFLLLAQSRSALEDERTQLLNQIELSQKLLSQKKQNRQSSLKKYKTLKTQVEQRRQLIENIDTEIQILNKQIEKNEELTTSLERDLVSLNKEFEVLIVKAYKNKLLKSNAFFLFSAQSFNALLIRWKYLRSIYKYRKRQAVIIKVTKEELEVKKEKLSSSKSEKQDLLSQANVQKEELIRVLREQNILLKKLQREEDSIASKISNQKKEHERLNKEIERIIREELAKAQRASRSRSESAMASTSASTSLNTSFKGAKGRLNWPVKKGIITSAFGSQPHATLKQVTEEKKGIEITTETNEEVLAIYEGTVAGSAYIPGKNYMVIIKHGDYFSVYSQLESLSVKEGQKVRQGAKLGTVAKDPYSNSYELFFQIYYNKKRLNPSKWIKNSP